MLLATKSLTASCSVLLRSSRIYSKNVFCHIPVRLFSDNPNKQSSNKSAMKSESLIQQQNSKEKKNTQNNQKLEQDNTKNENTEEGDQGSKKINTNIFGLILAGGCGLIAGYFIQNQQKTSNGKQQIHQHQESPEEIEIATKQQQYPSTDTPSTNKDQLSNLIGGKWQLLDTNGRIFGSNQLAGHYYLIYFGFCNCPDICPNSLTKIAQGLKLLREDPRYKNQSIKTVFVSVDPDRDTNQKIKDFLGLFSNEFIGVTGISSDDLGLKNTMKQFRIYATKMEYEDIEDDRGKDAKGKLKNNYTIDHSIITYLMSDNNEYLANFGPNLTDSEFAATLLKAIENNEQSKKNKINLQKQ